MQWIKACCIWAKKNKLFLSLNFFSLFFHSSRLWFLQGHNLSTKVYYTMESAHKLSNTIWLLKCFIQCSAVGFSVVEVTVESFKMSQEKNSKKGPIITNNFCFQVDFIRPTGPIVTMVTWYTCWIFKLLKGQNNLGKKF